MQPVSTSINIISCTILFYYLLYHTRSLYVSILLISFILFQTWHAFSHAQHINANYQSNIVHGILYLVYFSMLIAILHLSKQNLASTMWLFLFVAVILDLWIWYQIKGFWMVVSGLMLLSVVVIICYRLLPKFFKEAVPWLVTGIGTLILLIYNEEQNCDIMMNAVKFPYHAMVEIVGLCLFVALAQLFTHWDKCL